MYTHVEYRCDFCDDSFPNMNDCEKHEAKNHYHITPEEYTAWKQLYRDVSKFGGLLSRPNSNIERVKELRLNLDIAIEKLNDFTKEHSLDTHPTNWC